MESNKFHILGNAELVWSEIDNSLTTVDEKAAELIKEVAVIKEQVDNIRNTALKHSIPNGYTLAKDTDFEWREGYPWDGAWHYIGEDEKVIIPHTINGEKVTSYRGMFSETSVNSVYSDNTNVIDMNYMFFKSQATSLDLSSFDTSNVTDMGSMFSCSEATSLDLSNFNTSKVTNMSNMFCGSQAKKLDLSSFDISNVTDMCYIFYNSQATIGYAKTKDSADWFNELIDKPSTLTFKVKSTSLPNGYVLATDSDFEWKTENPYYGVWHYIGTDKKVAVPHIIQGKEVTSYRGMFRNTSVSGVYSDNSNVTDMSRMFQDSKATSLELSNFDTSNVTDMNRMFHNSQATCLDLSNFNTSKVTDMGFMFRASQATKLDLSSFDTSNVTNVCCMFEYSMTTEGYAKAKKDADMFNDSSFKPSELTFVVKSDTLPDGYTLAKDSDFNWREDYPWNGAWHYVGSNNKVAIPNTIQGKDVTSYRGMFRNTTVSGVYSDNTNVTDMSYMFDNSEATTLDLSSFDTSNVTDMGCMFWDSKATTLDLSSFDTSKVTDMSVMFSASRATRLDLSSFDTSSVTDMSNMFSYSKATILDLSSFNTSEVLNMAWMFHGSEATTGYARTNDDLDRFYCSFGKIPTLRFIVKSDALPDGYVWAKDSDFEWKTGFPWCGAWYYIGSDDMIAIPHKIQGKDVTSYRGMFAYTSVSAVYNDNPNVTDMRLMFFKSQATSLDLSSFNTSNATDMSLMFNDSLATSLDLSSFNTSNVTNMSSMFDNSQATSLDLSSFDTSKVTNMRYMFSESQAITLDLSKFNTSNVTNMCGMFNSSKAIELDLSNFDTSNVTDMAFMFNSSKAYNLDLSSFDTSNVIDMSWMFYNSNAHSLDLSNFDVSNVINISYMLDASLATSLDLYRSYIIGLSKHNN